MSEVGPLAQDAVQQPWTIVLSDIHLADAQLPAKTRPLWKRFKNPDLFIDDSFRRLLDALMADAGDLKLELVLNGDIFDFDSVAVLPDHPEFHIGWVERRRGLDSQEEKSVFKMGVILDTHPVWIESLRGFLERGHRVVFVVGNHDVELHWPSVQQLVRERIGAAAEDPETLRFCEWFYVSNDDTLIEHGNQYDAYCVCSDPIRPFIKKHNKLHVRTPFGNIASRVMVNGMGLFNPNVDSSFIMSFKEYVRFYFKYMLWIQPHLGWVWLWSSIATLVLSVREGLMPPHRNPFILEKRIGDIARRSNAPAATARALKELHAHPAIYSPWLILRELWLDRAFLFFLLVFVSIQGVAVVNFIVTIPLWTILLPLVALMPFLLFYARSVHSDVHRAELRSLQVAPDVGRIAGVGRVVLGHTHNELHTQVEGIEVLNTGSWSPAYHDVECTRPYGRKCLASIRARPGDAQRTAELLEWKDPGFEAVKEIRAEMILAKKEPGLLSGRRPTSLAGAPPSSGRLTTPDE